MPTQPNLLTSKQIPDHSILDIFNKQIYLGNNYTVVVPFTAGVAELPVLLLANNSTANPTAVSGIATALFQHTIKVIDLSPGGSVILRVYLNPTVTAVGTPVTPINTRTAYPNNSIATVTSGPTVSSFGTLEDAVSALAQQVGESDLLKILDPGQSILITALASAAVLIDAKINWYEI